MLNDFAENKKRSLCIKHKDSLKKFKRKNCNGQILSGGFNLVIFVSFNKEKLTSLDKKLKHTLFSIILIHNYKKKNKQFFFWSFNIYTITIKFAPKLITRIK